MEQHIYLKQILDLVYTVFGMNQSEVAGYIGIEGSEDPGGERRTMKRGKEKISTVGVNKSQISNALRGERGLHRIDIEKMFLHLDFTLPTDLAEDNQDRTFTTSRIIAYLDNEELLYSNIKQAAKKGYVAVVSAIMSHYKPGVYNPPCIPNTYDGFMKEGKEFSKNGNYQKALEAYSSAEGYIDGDRKNEMALYEKMAESYLKLGRYARAITLYRQALDICLFLNGEDSFDVAKLYECLGFVLRKDKQYSVAKVNFEKAENILSMKKERNPDDHEVAKLYNNIGLMYLNEKDFDKAKDYYEQSYAIRKNNFDRFGHEEDGFYVFEFAYSVHNMGTLHNKIVTDRIKILSEDERRKHLNKAVIFHKKAYEMRLELLKGEDEFSIIKRGSELTKVCMEIAQSLTLWASDLAELGEYESALEKCERGLKIREAKHGKGAEIQDIAWSFYTMGIIYDKQGKHENALKRFSESYRIRLKVCNGDHPYAAKALYQMGRMKYILMHTDALLDLKKALDIQKGTLKQDDPELLDTIELVGKIEKTRGVV
jgi:tetratricopeptide (TPR) repeat protein